MNDNEKSFGLRLEGNPDGAVAALKKVQSTAKEATDGVVHSFGSVGHGVEKLVGVVGILTGMLAGGAAFKGIINETTSWLGEVGKLSRGLGITAEEASVYKVALHGLGIDTDIATAATLRLAKSVAGDGGAAVEALGVKVYDTNGNMRSAVQIMGEVNTVLAGMKSGMDRNTAGMSVYGRSWGEVQQMLRLTTHELEEAKQTAEKLHLVFSSDDTAQVREYKKSMNELKLVGESISINVGSYLLPNLVNLGHFFNNYGPQGAALFADSLKGVIRITSELGVVTGTTVDKMIAYWRYLTSKGFSAKDLDAALANADKAGAEQFGEIYDMLYGKKNIKGPSGDNFNTMKDKRVKGGAYSGFSGTSLEKLQAFMDKYWQEVFERDSATGDAEGAGFSFESRRYSSSPLSWSPKKEKYSLLGRPGFGFDQGPTTDQLNSQGIMSVVQQAQFDAAAAANAEEVSNQQSLQRQQEFLAMKAQMNGDSTQAELLRIKQEEDQWIQSWAMQTSSFEEHERRKLAIQSYFDDQRVKVGIQQEQKLAQTRLTINENYLSAFGDVLQAANALAGGKMKVLYVLTQMASIATTFLSTQSAAAAALAPPPLGLGPIAGIGLAASIETKGYASMALQAATTMANAMNIGGGGSIGYGGGTPGSPIVTQPVSTQQSAAPQIQVVIQGNVIGHDEWVENDLAPTLRRLVSRNVDFGFALAK